MTIASRRDLIGTNEANKYWFIETASNYDNVNQVIDTCL